MNFSFVWSFVALERHRAGATRALPLTHVHDDVIQLTLPPKEQTEREPDHLLVNF